ncbi:tRNA-splicing endonuclease subunit [Tulasnella sp. 403]|nr:tRNA-splicing endonuclease subunit [Tulasnella sp. 403]
MDSPPQPIALHVSNNKAFVWDPEDAAALRRLHHVTGMLTGTLPSMAQQNIFLGLPLLLMPEEVVFLLESKVAVLLDDGNAHRPPTQSELASWRQLIQKHRAAALREVEDTKRTRQNVREQKTSEDALRKRKEREAKKLAAAAVATGNNDPATLSSLLVPTAEPEEAKSTMSGKDGSDQLRYHSHFVASVLLTSVTKLTPMQIVAYGRLGTGTKKAHLLCGWDEESNTVDYYSIEWANFG